MRLETTYETGSKDKISSTSIQTYDVVVTFKLNVVNEKQN